MDAILIEPTSLSFLCQVILSLAITLYVVLGVREKSRATWWLIFHMAGWAVCYVAYLAGSLGTELGSRVVSNYFQFLGGYIGGIAGIGFAYDFLGSPFPREKRSVLWTGGLVGLTFNLYFGYVSLLDLREGVMLSWLAWKWGTSIGVVLLTWGLFVHLRQAVHDPGAALHGHPAWRIIARRLRHPPTHAARAHRAFALVQLVWMCVLTLATLRNAQVLPLKFGDILFTTGYLVVLLATLVLFINYVPVPSTFQVKLVSLSLFSVLAFLGSTSVLLFSDEELVRDSRITLPSHRRLLFEPIGQSYRVVGLDASVEANAGTLVPFGPNRRLASIDLGFDFPFGGRSWRHVLVYEDGLVAFDSTMRRRRDLAFPASLQYAKEPWIAPLILPAGEAREVYVLRERSRAVFTWLNRDEPDVSPPPIQASLYADGRISFDYGAPVPFFNTLRGLATGQTSMTREARFDMISAPIIYDAGLLFEDYRKQFERFAHTRTVRLFWLILAASAFILGFFPFFYRGSLVRPLERLLAGVRRVNDGDLKTEVPVTVRDEIGLLTNQFNRMTRSLRRADEDLRTYADTLEQRVEERTVELAEKNQALEATLSELKATQAQLVQQEKLASLGALTAGIAHEIKNPLNFVNNFAGLTAELADELDESLAAYPAARTDIEDVLADLRLNARKIAEHGMRADGIVRSMLEHSRGSKGERQATDVNALLEEYVNLAYHGMRAQRPGSEVTIERDYDTSIGRVELVPQEMGRVFLNLLNNAFQAVDEGERAPTVRVSTHRADSHVEIRVADNGPGIPEAIRAKVFEPFFTTKPAGSGTGLGLSLSHDIIVKGYGGALRVESDEGRGATFIVCLPPERTTEAI